MKYVYLVLCVIGFSACVSKPLTPEEFEIKILRKSDAPANCKEMSNVQAYGMMAASEQGLEDDLKRATYKVGGDTVTWDRADANRNIFGTAYKCK